MNEAQQKNYKKMNLSEKGAKLHSNQTSTVDKKPLKSEHNVKRNEKVPKTPGGVIVGTKTIQSNGAHTKN